MQEIFLFLVREALVQREQVDWGGNQWEQKGKDHCGPCSACCAAETGIHELCAPTALT